MTPLPDVLTGKTAPLTAWRLDRARHATTWDSGEGAFQSGGRWNAKGIRAVYASLDPSTAVLEVAVHKGFKILDTQPHRMTRFTIAKPASVHVIQARSISDKTWLDPNSNTPAQKAWGSERLTKHKIIVLPSAVSTRSWNLVFLAPLASDWFGSIEQSDFVLDPRLHT